MGCFGKTSTSESTRLLDEKYLASDTQESADKDQESAGKTDQERYDRRRLICGYLVGLLAVVMVTTGLACTEALDKSIPHSELNGFRFLSQFILVSPFLIGINRCDIRVERESIGWLALAAISLTAASYANYGSVYYLPLGVSTGMVNSFILILNFVISSVRERFVCWYDLVASVLCVSGVTLVTQPPFLFHKRPVPSGTNTTHHPTCQRVYPSLYLANSTEWLNTTLEQVSHKHKLLSDDTVGYLMCGAASVILVVYMQVVNRKLAHMDVVLYTFWSAVVGTITSFVIMAPTETPYFPTIPECIAWVLVHASTAGTYSVVAYKAFQLLNPIVASLILTLQIPSSFVLQYTVFAHLHPGHADSVAITGATMVFIGNIFVPVYKLVLNRVKQKISNESDNHHQ